MGPYAYSYWYQKHTNSRQSSTYTGSIDFFTSAPALWIASALLFAWLALRTRTSRRDLPPGPRPLPLIGNALDIPSANKEACFRAMNEKYGVSLECSCLLVAAQFSLPFPGDVVHLDALGTPMIVLGTHEAAIDLLEKRSANYSDRLASTMAS